MFIIITPFLKKNESFQTFIISFEAFQTQNTVIVLHEHNIVHLELKLHANIPEYKIMKKNFLIVQ